MAYPTPTEIQNLVKDIALLIAQYNDYGTVFQTTLRGRTNAKITQIPNTATDERVVYLQRILGRDNADRNSIAGMQSSLISEINSYIETEGRRLLNTTKSRTVKQILTIDLVDAMNNCGTPQTIEANTVAAAVWENDGSSQTEDWIVEGVVAGTNSDAAGRLYVKLYESGGVYYVELYSDSGLSTKVAEGNRATAAGSITLAEAASSGVTGTVTIDYTTDDSDIVLYPPVQESGCTGNGTLDTASWSISQYAATQKWELECTNATTTDEEVWSVSGSISGRLTNAVTGTLYTHEESGLEFKIAAGDTGFAVGDKFYFWTYSSDTAVIMTFLREAFKAASLPTSASPTIPDSVAE